MNNFYFQFEPPVDPKEGAKRISHILTRCKIVHVTRPEGNFNDYYYEMAPLIGELVPMEENLSTGDKTGDLFTDIVYNPHIDNSFRHSSTRQPLHTDGSYEADAPNISFFYCIAKAQFGGATTFIDGIDLLRILSAHDQQLFKEACHYAVKFSKGSDSKTRPIIGNAGRQLTWNYYRAEQSDLCWRFHRFLEDKVVEGGLLTPILLQEGEALFFHDEMVLHGRNSFIGDRWLKKGGIKWTGS